MREFPSKMVVATDGKRSINLVVLNVRSKKISELTETDAEADGAESLEAMKTALARNYKGIVEDDLVTVMTFHLSK